MRKDFRDILREFKQEYLFSLAGFPITQGKLVNPLRKKSSNPNIRDNNPGCFYNWHNGILYFMDFTGYFGKAGVSAIEVLKLVTGIEDEHELYYYIKNGEDVEIIELPVVESFPVKIEWSRKRWQDFNYFSNYYIPKEVLEFENIYLVDQYSCSTRRSTEMIPNLIGDPGISPIVAYKFGDRVKLYNPWGDIKWFGNVTHEDVWGLETLDHGADELVITKSAKDYLVVKYILKKPCIAVQAEGNKKIFNSLHKYFENKKTYLIFDNDSTGKKMSKELCVEWGFYNVNIPQIKVGNSTVTDISDVVFFQGEKFLRSLAKNLFNDSRRVPKPWF